MEFFIKYFETVALEMGYKDAPLAVVGFIHALSLAGAAGSRLLTRTVQEIRNPEKKLKWHWSWFAIIPLINIPLTFVTLISCIVANKPEHLWWAIPCVSLLGVKSTIVVFDKLPKIADALIVKYFGK